MTNATLQRFSYELRIHSRWELAKKRQLTNSCYCYTVEQYISSSVIHSVPRLKYRNSSGNNNINNNNNKININSTQKITSQCRKRGQSDLTFSNYREGYFEFPYIDEGFRGPPPVKVESILFDWPGRKLWTGSSRGEYEMLGRRGATSGASRPSNRGSADKGALVVSVAVEGCWYDGIPVTDELSAAVVVNSGSLLHGRGIDRLPGAGGCRSGGKTVDGRRTLLRVGLDSDAAAVIREASMAEVRIDRRRAAAMSRSRGDCWRDISSSGGIPTTGDKPSAGRGLALAVLVSTTTEPLLLLHSEST